MAELLIRTISDIPATAKQLISAFQGRTVVAFSGPMGAGKTTLIKAICEEMGVKDTISSPTFSIVNEYHAPGNKIYHFDFYRINSLTEAYDLGYEEYFYSDAYCFIEWPGKIDGLLPENVMKVNISVDEGVRTLQF